MVPKTLSYSWTHLNEVWKPAESRKIGIAALTLGWDTEDFCPESEFQLCKLLNDLPSKVTDIQKNVKTTV